MHTEEGEKRRSSYERALLLQFCEEGTFIRHDLHFALHLPKVSFFEYSLKSFNYKCSFSSGGNSVDVDVGRWANKSFLHFFYILHVVVQLRNAM